MGTGTQYRLAQNNIDLIEVVEIQYNSDGSIAHIFPAYLVDVDKDNLMQDIQNIQEAFKLGVLTNEEYRKHMSD